MRNPVRQHFHDFGQLKLDHVRTDKLVLLNIAMLCKVLIIVPSRHIRQELQTKVAYIPKIEVANIPTGISPPDQTMPDQSTNSANGAQLRFGMVGRLSEAKAPAVWTRGAEMVLDDKHSDVSFHWYGENSLAESFIENLNHSENIVFHGPFQNQTKVYEKIDILLFSSIWEGGCPPRVILEAMFRSIPCILPKLPTIFEALGEGHCLYYRP